MPRTGRAPKGAASSRRRALSAKPLATTASAASLSTRCTSFSMPVRTSFLSAMRAAWRSTSAPGESGTLQAAASNAARCLASNSASSTAPPSESWSSSSESPRRSAR
jgi:hypothetical protein